MPCAHAVNFCSLRWPAPASSPLIRALPQLPRGSSWLEALADWRMPTLLLALADADGEMPGHAAAHAALCRQLHVPLVGLVQLQGHWDAPARRRDGLPWCGWVPDTDHPQHEDGLDALVERISRGRFTGPVARAAV